MGCKLYLPVILLLGGCWNFPNHVTVIPLQLSVVFVAQIQMAGARPKCKFFYQNGATIGGYSSLS